MSKQDWLPNIDFCLYISLCVWPILGYVSLVTPKFPEWKKKKLNQVTEIKQNNPRFIELGASSYK